MGKVKRLDKDLDLNVSDEVNGKIKYQKRVLIFLQKYKIVLETNGQTSKFVSQNIDTLSYYPTLSGEALHLFIDDVKANKIGIHVGRILKEIFYVNMMPGEDPFSLQDIDLKLIDGLATNGIIYLTKTLVEYGEGKALYNSIVKFLVAYNRWKVRAERAHYIAEMNKIEYYVDDIESRDTDILYWLDLQDGEILEESTSTPSDRWGDDDWTYHYETYEDEEEVKSILEQHMDIIMESDLFSQNQKLNLVQLYAKSVERVRLNSTMIYGQLKLVYEQLKSESKKQGISEINITSRIMQFYKGLTSQNFQIAKLDLSEFKPKCAFIIVAEVKNDIIKSISAHQLKTVEENLSNLDACSGDFQSKSFIVLLNDLINLSVDHDVIDIIQDEDLID
jgi:hypothetical protein